MGLVLTYLSIPLQIVTHLAGGCLIAITFGLLLLPLSLIWVAAFLAPIAALSWLWNATSRFGALSAVIHLPIAVVGVPLAALGVLYVDLVPETDSAALRQKLLICQTFPFTLDFLREQRYTAQSRSAPRSADSDEFSVALREWSELRHDDAARREAYARVETLLDTELRQWRLTKESYDRVTNIVAELDGYGRYRRRD